MNAPALSALKAIAANCAKRAEVLDAMLAILEPAAEPDCDLCHEPAAECDCPPEYMREHDAYDMER